MSQWAVEQDDHGFDAWITKGDGIILWLKPGVVRNDAAIKQLMDDLAERERLWALLDDVAESCVEHDDPRLDYVTVQMDRSVWERLPARASLRGKDQTA